MTHATQSEGQSHAGYLTPCAYSRSARQTQRERDSEKYEKLEHRKGKQTTCALSLVRGARSVCHAWDGPPPRLHLIWFPGRLSTPPEIPNEIKPRQGTGARVSLFPRGCSAAIGDRATNLQCRFGNGCVVCAPTPCSMQNHWCEAKNKE